MKEILDYFDTPEKVSVLISAIAALIAAISTVAAIWSNIMNSKRYRKSMEPQLSMELVNFSNVLYLQIKNTGKTVATEICLTPQKLSNNGDNGDKVNQDGLFATNFELYPEELVQTEIAFCYDTVCSQAFPQLTLLVSYKQLGVKKPVKYTRTITYAPAYNSKILADVNLDTRNIESSLRHISRASVRTANYLDGHQVAEFDELDILSEKSLENDLRAALNKDSMKICCQLRLQQCRRCNTDFQWGKEHYQD